MYRNWPTEFCDGGLVTEGLLFKGGNLVGPGLEREVMARDLELF